MGHHPVKIIIFSRCVCKMESLADIKANGDRLLRHMERLENNLINTKTKLESVRQNSQDITKCVSLFQSWITTVVDQNVNSISELVTSGLSNVIDDQNLQFKINQEAKNNKSVFTIQMINNGIESDPIEGTGGGIASLISTIIRFSLTAKFGLSKLILLDETLSSLSNAYVPAAAAFLRELCKEFGIDILMVTHNPDFINESDTSYEAINDGKLKLKRIK